MGVLEGTQVLWESRIRGADLRRFNGKMCFSQATAAKQFIVWSQKEPRSAQGKSGG